MLNGSIHHHPAAVMLNGSIHHHPAAVMLNGSIHRHPAAVMLNEPHATNIYLLLQFFSIVYDVWY
jgi:hypothetical protein